MHNAHHTRQRILDSNNKPNQSLNNPQSRTSWNSCPSIKDRECRAWSFVVLSIHRWWSGSVDVVDSPLSVIYHHTLFGQVVLKSISNSWIAAQKTPIFDPLAGRIWLDYEILSLNTWDLSSIFKVDRARKCLYVPEPAMHMHLKACC